MDIKIGKRAYKNNCNDYAGKIGTIKWCSTCCKANRVQFKRMANNEALSNFNILKCAIIANK